MLSFRSPPELNKLIDAYADERGQSRAEAIRELVGKGLSSQ